MIESVLKECVGVTGVVRLFTELGYPVHPVVVEEEDLHSLGLSIVDVPIQHLVRYGGVDLYVVTPCTEEHRVGLHEFERVLSARNPIIRPVIVELGMPGETRLTIHSRSGRSKRRLDVDLHRPSADVIDRVCGLRVEGRPGDLDPALLFDHALDREALGRRFFEQFRRATLRVGKELTSRCKGESPAACREQALLLLSRVLFVYLLQRKGWLDGDHRFCRERLADCVRRGTSYQTTVLNPLFFDCLNRPEKARSAKARRLGKVPYLNGGLFEPSAFEERNEIELPNPLWEDVLDSTFESFSLSVSEGDDEAAHIDPEMLGKVFERLMESEERARTGTFYTPRSVVDRLAGAAIVRWCGEGDESLITELSSVLRGERKTIELKRARKALRRIETIRVLDPACGSGAFLLAALRTIELLTRALKSVVGETPRDDLRAHIASTSLFGVDVKMEAVRLCELRIWLAIVSGTDLEIDSVPPLPNLDRNVLQGDSLVGPLDFLAEGRSEIYREWRIELREREALIDAYRHSSSEKRRKLAVRLRDSDESLARALLDRSLERDRAEMQHMCEGEPALFEGAPELWRKKSSGLESRIESTARLIERLDRHETPFFSFDLHFANVFADGGFSVVVGNPPWVRGSRVDPELRRLLADRYRSFSSIGSSGFRQTELAMAFVERSLALAEEGGVIAQLVPSKILNADYARQARELLGSSATVNEIVDWSTEGRALFGADVFPLGLVASKLKSNTGSRVEISAGGERYSVCAEQLGTDGPGSPWSVIPPDVRSVVDRARGRFGSLADVLGRPPFMGVKTGANKTFFLEDVDVGNGVVRALDIELPARAVVRTVRGRDLRSWTATDSTWMLWPPALAGDDRLRREIARKLGIDVASLRLSYVRSEHLGLKVAWKDVSRGLRAAILPDRTTIDGVSFAVVPNQTLYSIDASSREDALVLAALLNSSVVNALALEVAERAKDHHWRYMASVIGALPFPRLTPGSTDFVSLVKLARRAELGGRVQKELDQLVARIYGIETREEMVLSKFVRQRLGLGCALD